MPTRPAQLTPDHAGTGAWIRQVRASWRRLTGGASAPESARSTLVAVSGGADSASLAIALATLADARIVLGCVQHDLRPAELVSDDREAVAQLASRLGVRLMTAHLATPPGNAEHETRRQRYSTLERMASAAGCAFIATAHHAHDQIETVLMALGRGGSPDALRGILEQRPAKTGPQTVIRPMLSLDPSQCRAVCTEHGYTPRIDATNRDPARTRSRVRHTLLPALFECFPEAGPSVVRAAERVTERLAGEQDLEVGDELVDPG